MLEALRAAVNSGRKALGESSRDKAPMDADGVVHGASKQSTIDRVVLTALAAAVGGGGREDAVAFHDWYRRNVDPAVEAVDIDQARVTRLPAVRTRSRAHLVTPSARPAERREDPVVAHESLAVRGHVRRHCGLRSAAQASRRSTVVTGWRLAPAAR